MFQNSVVGWCVSFIVFMWRGILVELVCIFEMSGVSEDASERHCIEWFTIRIDDIRSMIVHFQRTVVFGTSAMVEFNEDHVKIIDAFMDAYSNLKNNGGYRINRIASIIIVIMAVLVRLRGFNRVFIDSLDKPFSEIYLINCDFIGVVNECYTVIDSIDNIIQLNALKAKLTALEIRGADNITQLNVLKAKLAASEIHSIERISQFDALQVVLERIERLVSAKA